jgi:hypothetical protein
MNWWLLLFAIFPFGPLLWIIKRKDEEYRCRHDAK